MYGGFDVFKTYLAVKNHFTTDYDYNKYGGRVTAKLESFTKRPDRYFFHKLSKRYNERDILDYFVSNFAVDGNKWVGNLINNEGTENYTRYRKYKDAFDYHFRNDCVSIRNDFDNRSILFNDGFLVHMGQHPRVLRLHFNGKFTSRPPSYLIQYYRLVRYGIKKLMKKLYEPKIAHTLAKLKPFVIYNETQAKLIMKDVWMKNN